MATQGRARHGMTRYRLGRGRSRFSVGQDGEWAETGTETRTGQGQGRARQCKARKGRARKSRTKQDRADRIEKCRTIERAMQWQYITQRTAVQGERQDRPDDRTGKGAGYLQ